MSKSVLILDTPKTCKDCMFCFELEDNTEACCSVADDDVDSSMCKGLDFKDKYWKRKPAWCPLKGLPKEESGDEDLCSFDRGLTAGFNACLQKIRGENI